MIPRHRVMTALLLMLTLTLQAWLLAGCGERSKVDPNAKVTVSGVVRDVNGSPLTDRPLRMGSGVPAGDAMLAVLTAGLACTSGICHGKMLDTKTDDSGAYSFSLKGRDTQSSFGEARTELVSVSAKPVGQQVSGASASARFFVQTPAVKLPRLQLVDPHLSLSGHGQDAEAKWSTPVCVSPPPVATPSAEATPAAGATASPSCARPTGVVIELDGDVPADVVVVRGCVGGCAVDTSVDGQSFQPAGAVADEYGLLPLNGQAIRAVRVHLGAGELREVSVWRPGTGATEVRSPSGRALDRLRGPFDIQGARNRAWLRPLIGLAVVLLVVAVVGIAYLAGRRSRPPRPGQPGSSRSRPAPRR